MDKFDGVAMFTYANGTDTHFYYLYLFSLSYLMHITEKHSTIIQSLLHLQLHFNYLCPSILYLKMLQFSELNVYL